MSCPAAPPRPDADALYRALRAPVLALCLRLTGSRADAEDALQDVFTSVHRALPAFRGEARPATWIYRIAIRAALRIRARRRETVPLDPERDATARPEDVLAARDEVRRVAAAFDRLSADHRTVLSLFALDGLSQRELAEILGVPRGRSGRASTRRARGSRRRSPAAVGQGRPERRSAASRPRRAEGDDWSDTWQAEACDRIAQPQRRHSGWV